MEAALTNEVGEIVAIATLDAAASEG